MREGGGRKGGDFDVSYYVILVYVQKGTAIHPFTKFLVLDVEVTKLHIFLATTLF
jgi:hypothetical protein